MFESLPPAFTLGQARLAGIRKDQIYKAVADGQVERVGRGVYVRAGSVDPAFAALAAATAIRPEATLCLASALVHFGLTDAIPPGADIALPRGVRHPAGFAHVQWHSFDKAAFPIGREPVSGHSGLFTYSPERAIVDSFRLAHQEGRDVALEALRRWLRRRGNYPAKLLEVAGAFPKAYPSLRAALEVLA